MSHTERVIVLVDMDCFYCQVEEILNPKLKDRPIAVVQYNAWQGGGIIAVNYKARDCGVTRHMRGDEASRKCPQIELVRVPDTRGKADLSKYREAGKSVAKILHKFTPLLERASVDEAYLDITEAVNKRLNGSTSNISCVQLKNTHVIGCDIKEFLYDIYYSGLYIESNSKLAMGGVITEEIRAAVFKETGFTCSAGIAHNKILAKLACGLHKPNKQTILPQDNVQGLFNNIPVYKIRSLGGKFGNSLMEDLGVQTMADLIKFGEKELAKRYDDKTAAWLYNIARGIDTDPVVTRLIAKSIGCCKKFPGKSALIAAADVEYWLKEFAKEIAERLEQDFEENNRRAKQMVVSFSHDVGGREVANSRTCLLKSYEVEKIAEAAFEIVKKNYALKSSESFNLKYLGISAGKFENCHNVKEITSFFKAKEKDEDVPNEISDEEGNCIELTQDLNENSSDLIFYENNNISDSDSITNELSYNKSDDQKESFFLRYFESAKRATSPVKRDFDTSLNLEEVTNESEDTCINNISETSSDNVIETCPECCIKILRSEMLSHSDYHFALNLKKEESILNKKKPSPNQKDKAKRKIGSISTLERFFQTVADNAEGETEICRECNKKISVGDLVSHLDYHVAKRLHMEINPVKSAPPKTSRDKKVQSVKSFLRPAQ